MLGEIYVINYLAIISILSLVFLLMLKYINSPKNNDSIDREKRDFLLDEISKLQEMNCRLSGRINQLENEVVELKRLSESQKHKISLEQNRRNELNEIPFSQSMNYRQFIQNNHEVVKLINDGCSNEDISQKLNKSICEIEMIRRFIK
ncbi:hypothetical protein SAMN05192551_101230 [Tindallia magadiensis]|uniref:Uncharacterized protein n=1 Tax=Tindallia magadiensis TaxID=69895 RepID=A0A1I3AI59_9FIRM|nr:hypothetical protein SAMN05192551_101230 [Tindallia magadiensis]